MTVYAPIMQIVGKPALPPTTQYGYAIDYLYAVNHFDDDGAMGSNIAHRAGWPIDIYIYAREFTEKELDEQGLDNPLPYGVFLVFGDDESEYKPTDKAMEATDWLIGVRA